MKNKPLDFNLNFLDKADSKKSVVSSETTSFDREERQALKVAFITTIIICTIVVVVAYAI